MDTSLQRVFDGAENPRLQENGGNKEIILNESEELREPNKDFSEEEPNFILKKCKTTGIRQYQQRIL